MSRHHIGAKLELWCTVNINLNCLSEKENLEGEQVCTHHLAHSNYIN